jgi:hypothetical protein
LKATEDVLISIVNQVKDQEDTIVVLKRALANGKISFMMPMRIKIKEVDLYDDAHNAKLLDNFFGDIEVLGSSLVGSYWVIDCYFVWWLSYPPSIYSRQEGRIP